MRQFEISLNLKVHFDKNDLPEGNMWNINIRVEGLYTPLELNMINAHIMNDLITQVPFEVVGKIKDQIESDIKSQKN